MHGPLIFLKHLFFHGLFKRFASKHESLVDRFEIDRSEVL